MTGRGTHPGERELAYTDLRDWIKALEKAGELKRITVEVSPDLEMAEIADRTAKLHRGTAKAGGPALLFENIKGHPGARVLMNQFGSLRRMQLALETDSLDDIANRIRTLLKPQTPTSFMDKMKLLPTLAEVGSFFPKVVSAKTPPASRSSIAAQTSTSSTSPSSKPGPRTAAPSSPSPASSPAIPAVPGSQASAT